MDLHERFNLALRLSGFPPLQSSTAYRQIGAGSWHDAYVLALRDGSQLVVRLRKQVIYGRREVFDEQSLHEDYAPVGVYYAQANRCWPGICPAIYTYHIQPDLICTIESYMGTSIDLAALSPGAALAYGEQLGAFFRAMHALPPPIEGCGNLVWRDGRLIGQGPRDPAAMWQAEIVRIQEQLERLRTSDLPFDRAAVTRAVEQALAERSFAAEPLALVNRDITPENMLIQTGGAAGLVDPVPLIHNPTRYASFFRFCYTFLLPALSDAPRYARHQFKRHEGILAAITEGYIKSYTASESSLSRALDLDDLLWLLGLTAGYYQLLSSDITEEQRLRTGGKSALAANVRLGLRRLEQESMKI